MNTPIINIKYGKLIDPFFRDSVKISHPEYKFPEIEDVLKKVSLFKDAWNKQESQIITFLYNETGLEFKRHIIDCVIVSATTRDMSAPLIIRSRYDEAEFVSIMLHELIHILFSDNLIKVEGYEDESKTTRNHIRLFVLMKKYYIEVLNEPELLDKIMSIPDTEINKDYVKAWEIVNSMKFE